MDLKLKLILKMEFKIEIEMGTLKVFMIMLVVLFISRFINNSVYEPIGVVSLISTISGLIVAIIIGYWVIKLILKVVK